VATNNTTGLERLTDNEIISNLISDRALESTIRYLYRDYFEYTGHYVVNNNGTWDDAADIFQEVLVSFIHLVKAGKFRGEAAIRTFLYSLTRNVWLNELKRRNRAQLRETRYEHAKEEADPGISSIMESREAAAGLLKAVEQLGENCKTILLLYYFENRSMKEILTEMHYENEQVIRNKKYKCLKKLENMLASDKNLYNQLKNYFHV
jgi:RNA polymerase sigma factor (sigma-70 family)